MGSFLLQAPLPSPIPHGFVWETGSLWCFSYLSFWWGTGRIEQLISQVPAQGPVSHINGEGSKDDENPLSRVGECSVVPYGLVRISLPAHIHFSASLGNMEMGRKVLILPCGDLLPHSSPQLFSHLESFSPWSQPVLMSMLLHIDLSTGILFWDSHLWWRPVCHLKASSRRVGLVFLRLTVPPIFLLLLFT